MRACALPLASLFLFLIGVGCTTKVHQDAEADREGEAIMVAVLDQLFAEQAAVAVWHEKRDSLGSSDDPFAPISPEALESLPPPPTMPAAPGSRFCVQIFGKDPSADFFQHAPGGTQRLLPGSSFRKHPRFFGSPQERLAYEHGDMPELIRLESIRRAWFSRSLRVEITFYRHESNAEGWEYQMMKTDGKWRVVRRRSTWIS